MDAFDTHQWNMKRSGTNRLGEPVYVAMCKECFSTPREIQRSDKSCKEVQNANIRTGIDKPAKQV